MTTPKTPWITDAELEALRRQAKKIDFKKIGELVGLKHLERWHDDVRMFSWAACDISPQEAARFKLKRDRENATRRQAKRRDSVVKMKHTSKRDDAVLGMLRTLSKPLVYQAGMQSPPLKGWLPVSALVKEAEHCHAFRRPDGYSLRNLRNAVHLVLKTLKDSGQIETMQQPGPRGMVMYVRERPSNVTYLRTKITDLVSAA
jgi:hypothetical protein